MGVSQGSLGEEFCLFICFCFFTSFSKVETREAELLLIVSEEFQTGSATERCSNKTKGFALREQLPLPDFSVSRGTFRDKQSTSKIDCYQRLNVINKFTQSVG